MDSEKGEVHKDYVANMAQQLEELTQEDRATTYRVVGHEETIKTLAAIDLEPARAKLMEGYSQRKSGKRPRDPIAMFRSIMVMAMLACSSYNTYVHRLRGEPELAIMSGFEVDDTPGVGTYYDFDKRLVNGKYQKRCDNCNPVKPAEQITGRNFRRNLDTEKKKRLLDDSDPAVYEPPTMNAVKKAVEKLGDSLEPNFVNMLNEILMTVGVAPSLEMGLLGPKDKLHVGGDGSIVPSQGKGQGKYTCTCRKDGNGKTCTCDRIYSDPTAMWGYDHTRKIFVFGFKIHTLVAKHETTDLTLRVDSAPANPADVLMGIQGVVAFHKTARELDVSLGIDAYMFDAGYDAEWFFKLIITLGSRPVIALNPKNTKIIDYKNIPRDKKTGNPLCPGGAICRHQGFVKRQQKHVWHCPAKRPSKLKGKYFIRSRMDLCPTGKLCEPDSKIGPIYNIPISSSYRLNPPIPRSSELHKTLYKKRTATERFNSEFKQNLTRPYRREHLNFIHVMATAISTHGNAMARHRLGETKAKTVSELLNEVRYLGNLTESVEAIV